MKLLSELAFLFIGIWLVGILVTMTYQRDNQTEKGQENDETNS